MKITYLGHACFEVVLKNKTLLFDPFISGNDLAKGIDIDKLKPDYILISHGHQDHIADAVHIAKNSGATVISNFEIVNWLLGKGVKKGHPMNIGGKFSFDFGDVKFFNAVHSSVLPDGTYGGNPGGFIIQSDEGHFYYAGDTGLTYDMKLIGEYSCINFAFLPIGNNFTMGIDNAIIASKMINCNKIIGMHYDTFPYIVIDKEEALDKFHRVGKELILLKIGESFNFQK
ncbi:MAG TPA: metal-dependent hydrolase [Bacteroidales bacterium]|nr:metal-dependent hydrolase [Bacteroidales bacterium]HPS17375.1 metal-dependent hydrolase [Bacteroidales bacterium]